MTTTRIIQDQLSGVQTDFNRIETLFEHMRDQADLLMDDAEHEHIYVALRLMAEDGIRQARQYAGKVCKLRM